MRKLSSVQLLSYVQLFATHGCQHQLQSMHARLPCPSPTPRACSNSCPFSWWCHPTISSSVIPFSSWLQSFPAIERQIFCQSYATLQQQTLLFSFPDKGMGLGTSNRERAPGSQTRWSDWTELTELNPERARGGALLSPSWAPSWQSVLITDCVRRHFGCPASRDLDHCSPSGPLPLITYKAGKENPPSGTQ